MSLSERRAMWQERIEAFKETGEKSVATWCREHQINVNSMYSWLKKDAEQQVGQTEPKAINWVPVQPSVENIDVPSSPIVVKLGQFSLEVEENFNQDVFNNVLEVLQCHVK